MGTSKAIYNITRNVCHCNLFLILKNKIYKPKIMSPTLCTICGLSN